MIMLEGASNCSIYGDLVLKRLFSTVFYDGLGRCNFMSFLILAY